MKGRGSRGVTAAIAAVATIAIALVVFTNQHTATAIERNRAWNAAVQKIETNVARSHVWIEEGIAGDRSIDFRRDVLGLVSGEVGRCDGLLAGRGGPDRLPAIRGRGQVASTRVLCRDLRGFRNLSVERWRQRRHAHAGTPLAQAFDASFDALLRQTHRVELAIGSSLEDTRRELRLTSAGTIALLLALFGTMAAVVRRRSHELERLASSNELILASAADGIVGLDRSGRAQFVNRAAGDMTGYAPDELVGRGMHEVLTRSRPDGSFDPTQEGPLYAPLTDGTAHSSEDVYRRKDGTSFPIEFTTTPIEEDGTVVGAVVVFRDVSERQAAEQAKDEFLATVSHELRTPLTSIQGYTEMLIDGEGGEPTPEQRRFLEIVRRNSERLQSLVGDLLFVAQADSGSLVLERDEVNLAEVVRDAVRSAEPAAAANEVGLTLALGELPSVRGDRVRLGQVLDNLLSNAVKFTPAGGHVDVRAFAASDCAVLEVEDTGMGMSHDEQQHLFKRFFRTAGARREAIQGTGLGLTIAKTIVTAHGGTIAVESEKGRGTTFRVELPVAAAVAHPEPRREREESLA